MLCRKVARDREKGGEIVREGGRAKSKRTAQRASNVFVSSYELTILTFGRLLPVWRKQSNDRRKERAKKARKEVRMATRSLYVGNLPYSITESQLLELFATFGASSARVIEGRGFGFVDVDEEQMQAAIDQKHDSEFEGRALVVNEARPRDDSSSGGRRRGGRY